MRGFGIIRIAHTCDKWLRSDLGLCVVFVITLRVLELSLVTASGDTWSDTSNEYGKNGVGLTIIHFVGLAFIVRYLFRVQYLSLIRSELDRFQKGESWSAEGLFAVTIFPALSMWICESGWGRVAAGVQIAFFGTAFTVLNSSIELRKQIGRFSPGFSTGNSIQKAETRLWQLPTLIVLLICSVFPPTSGLLTYVSESVANVIVEICRGTTNAIVAPRYVEWVNSASILAIYTAFTLSYAAWLAKTASLILEVLVHAHLSVDQGHRLSKIREVLAITILIAICFGTLGNEMIRPAAAAFALFGLAWFQLAYNPTVIQRYLGRMRVLR